MIIVWYDTMRYRQNTHATTEMNKQQQEQQEQQHTQKYKTKTIIPKRSETQKQHTNVNNFNYKDLFPCSMAPMDEKRSFHINLKHFLQRFNCYSLTFSLLEQNMISKRENGKSKEMLLNIGVRSAGTVEFRSKMEQEFMFETICANQRIYKKKSLNLSYTQIECRESHYWDRYICYQVNNNNNNNNKKNNYHVTAGGQSNCNINEYFDLFLNNYDKRAQYGPFVYGNKKILSLDNTLFYDKTPRYYLYPHIGYIFGLHKYFSNMKVFVLLRDPIKSSLSTYYDLGTSVVGYKNFFQTHFLSDELFNFIKDEILAKYLPKIELNNCVNPDCSIIFNNIDNNNIADDSYSYSDYDINEDINVSKLKSMWMIIDDMYKKAIYIEEGSAFVDALARGRALGFRNCPMIPLMTWLQVFRYFDVYFDVLSNSTNDDVKSTTDTNTNEKRYFQNRFRIVQSEYFFDNLEKVSNEIYCWAKGYDPNNNCGSSSASYDRKRASDSRKKYNWINLDQHDVAHAHQSQYDIVPQSYLYYLAQFFYPCTVHTFHWMQIMNQSSLILGTFDPNLWTNAIAPMLRSQQDNVII